MNESESTLHVNEPLVVDVASVVPMAFVVALACVVPVAFVCVVGVDTSFKVSAGFAARAPAR